MNLFTVFKPQGPTSFDIIAQIKRATGERRVGHAGTLDPMAEGVLVVGLGREATRQLDEIVQKEKEYIADIKLGVTSTTDDEEGEKHITPNTKPITIKEIKNSLINFVGIIEQVPPIHSAIKVQGQRAYKLARSGKNVELKSRPVEIKKIKILKYKYPNLKIKVICGSGVYIRSLARDIGASLGSGGYMSGLTRTRVGQFKMSKALTVSEIAKIYLNQEVKILKNGGIGIIPTDTIYGLIGLALNKITVARIYKVRQRSPDKPLIILISSINDLKKFGVKLNKTTKNILKKYWPGAVSVILPCDSKLEYLHRGTNTLAFRLPNDEWLKSLIKRTGPLVAPSANPEGSDPALTITQSKKYFNNLVDFYFDRGKRDMSPSTLIKIEDDKIIVLRKGSVDIN